VKAGSACTGISASWFGRDDADPGLMNAQERPTRFKVSPDDLKCALQKEHGVAREWGNLWLTLIRGNHHKNARASPRPLRCVIDAAARPCCISKIYAPPRTLSDGLAIISQKIVSTAPKAGNPKANQTRKIVRGEDENVRHMG
jgi:hypothetical protein